MLAGAIKIAIRDVVIRPDAHKRQRFVRRGKHFAVFARAIGCEHRAIVFATRIVPTEENDAVLCNLG
jgi:hypothetical protein